MKNINIVFLLVVLTFSANGQDLNQLKVHQPLLENIFAWGEFIIAEKDYSKGDKFYKCDLATQKLQKLEIEGSSDIICLTETKSVQLAIMKINDSFYLMKKFKNDIKWKKEKLFSGFKKEENTEFVANDSLFVLVTSNKLFYKKPESDWQFVFIDSLFDREFLDDLKKYSSTHCVLTSHLLFLGYDNGEWGGKLIKIPFSTENKYAFQKGQKIFPVEIKSIIYSKDGYLWFASDIDEGFMDSGIYKYKDSTVEIALSIPSLFIEKFPEFKAYHLPDNINYSNSTLLLKEHSDLSAFYLQNMEVPYFVASQLGIFKIANDSLEQIIKANLYINYDIDGFTVESYPQAMYVDRNDNIFIASRSLGVFVYTKNKDKYDFVQLTFE